MRYLFLTLVILLSSCSSIGKGTDGTPGKKGTNRSQLQNGKNGTNGKKGQDKSSTIGIKA